jgi:hypothetical protein
MQGCRTEIGGLLLGIPGGYFKSAKIVGRFQVIATVEVRPLVRRWSQDETHSPGDRPAAWSNSSKTLKNIALQY